MRHIDTPESSHRSPTPIDALADAYLETMATLSPAFATQAGIAGHDHELDDFSPEGQAARTEAAQAALARIAQTPARDSTDRVTKAAMAERLALDIECAQAGDHLRDLNNIESPLQGIRDVFDLMAVQTTADWEIIAERLAAVPAAVRSYETSLAEGRQRGLMPASRQVGIGIDQAAELARPGSFFDAFTASARPDGSALSESLAKRLSSGAAAARAAYGELADWLRDELAPQAPQADAVGRERYARASRLFVGMAVDIDETYAWGLDEVARIVAEENNIAHAIAGPEATLAQAIATLDADPSWLLHGTGELREWMTRTSHEALDFLNGRYFDIPEPLLDLECRIAPTQNGGIYYTGPSEDFSRPGRMWWSVPPSVHEFSTWRERSTVYHEGVPGHHMQIGRAMYESDKLNRWRRMGCWVSGHGEGWALYAEGLMDEFGFLATPADRLGMLDSELMRACRVVIDMGLHCGLPCPEQWGGGVWDEAKAWRFFTAHVSDDPAFLRFELDRYLGWPGQAPSYKIGQRCWQQVRADAAARQGAAFNLKNFHNRALSLGALGLDVLRQALAGDFDEAPAGA